MQSTWSRNWEATPVSLPRKLHGEKQKAKDLTLGDEPLRLEGVQHATEEEWRTSTSSSRANEVVGPKPINAQLRIRLEVKGKSNAAKKNTA